MHDDYFCVCKMLSSLTCAFGGELEHGSVVVVSVGVLAGNPGQVDCSWSQLGKGESTSVRLALKVHGVQLLLLPSQVLLRAVLNPGEHEQFEPQHWTDAQYIAYNYT